MVACVASLHKTLDFYFWHDDFSVFYYARVNCIAGWPYRGYCTIFSFLEKFLHYHPTYYFALGLLFFIFLCWIYYSLFNNFTNDRSLSLLTTLLIAASYTGAGIFLEVYDSITLFLSLGLFTLSLLLLLQSTDRASAFWRLGLSFFVFVISLVVLRVRSAAYPFVYISAVIIFGKWRRWQKLGIVIWAFVLYYFFYYLWPSGSSRVSDVSSAVVSLVSRYPVAKLKYFFESLSSIVIPDGIFILSDRLRLFIGAATISLMTVSTYRSITNSRVFRIKFFALVWIFFQHLPYSLKSSWRLETTNRYLFPAYLGMLIFWLAVGLETSKKKIWYFVSLVVVAGGVLLSNHYFFQYQIWGSQRRTFYSELHRLLPTIPEGAVICVNFPVRLENQLGDLFRVGALPSEATLGAEYSIDYSHFTLITDLDQYERYKGTIRPDKLFVFYYDGYTLTDWSLTARALITSKKKWFSNSGINKGTYILPSTLTLNIKSWLPASKINYNEKTSKTEANFYLGYFSVNRSLKNSVRGVTVSSFGENTNSNSLADGNPDTYWLANKQEWSKGKKQAVDVVFSKPETLEGLVIRTSRINNMPTQMEIYVEGTKLQTKTEVRNDGDVKIIFPQEKVSGFSLKILETMNDDSPMINEIDFVPGGYKTVTLFKLSQYRSDMRQLAVDFKTTELLRSFLSTGFVACLKWNAPGHGEGKVLLKLFPDSRLRTYQVPLPALGPAGASFELGCEVLPTRSEVDLVSLSY